MIGKKALEHIRRGSLARAIIFASAFALAAFFALALASCASGTNQAQGQESADFLQGQEEPRETAEQLAVDEFFEPERFEEIFPRTSAATFKTSKPKCALYVNGEYHGLTPLKVAGLVPGRYAVQIKREGYKTVNITIQVKDGISDFYYIEMEADDEPVNQGQSQETPEL